MGLVQLFEFKWSGNWGLDYSKAEEKFKNDAIDLYNQARSSKIDSIIFIGFSAGNALMHKGIMDFNNLNERDFMKEGLGKIEINIINTGSLADKSVKEFANIAYNTGGQHINFRGSLDPFALLSPSSQNSRMIFGFHTLESYFNNPEVELPTLSIVTGIDIPMAYFRFSSGSFSDLYSSFSFRTQETILDYGSGMRSITTQTWTHYETYPRIPSTSPWGTGNRFKYNPISPWQYKSPFDYNYNQYKIPRIPSTNYGPRFDWP